MQPHLRTFFIYSVAAIISFDAWPAIGVTSKSSPQKKPTKPNAAKVEILDQPGTRVVPAAKSNPCTVAALQAGRNRLAAAKKRGQIKTGVVELQKTIDKHCRQLPSKYVRPGLNKSYFLAVADLAEAKRKLGDIDGCLKWLTPLTRPDSAVSYAALGFDSTEPSAAALDAVEERCLNEKPIKRSARQ